MEITLKPKHLKLHWQLILSALLATLAVYPISSSANSSTDPAFDVQASLVTPAQISLGEPVLIRYNIQNISGQAAALHMGMDRTDWYTIVLRDSEGHVVSVIPDNHAPHPMEAFWTMNTFSPDEKGTNEYIPVSTFLAIQKPGKYTLTVRANLKYALINDTAVGLSNTPLESSCLKQTQDITLPILVTAPDSNRLHAIAEALRKAVSDTGTNGKLLRADMDMLFFMPEAQVSAVWKDLATKPSMNSDLVASELEALHSKTGVDILVNMLDVPKLKCMPVSARINRIYNAADPVLREHIKAVARERGFEMPEHVGGPIILD